MFNMNRRKYPEILTYFILLIALLAPRVMQLNSFATLDEPYWLSMGANFYYALGQREFQNTVYEYQPAVTTMWIVTAAMIAYFPEFRGLGQGYLEFEKGALDPFLLAQGQDPLVLLEYARFIQVLLVSILFLLFYYLLGRIFSKPIAFFVTLFASLDPYLLGQSRLLNHEGMVSLFVVLSVVAFYIFVTQGRRMPYLLLSGILCGLAQLTKSSAMAILLPIGVLLLWQVLQQKREDWGRSTLEQAKYFGIWLGVLLVTYIVVWPGMWVAPLKMLGVVYGNAFSYAFQGARLSAITEEVQAAPFSISGIFVGMWSLMKVVIWRTTPFTWLGGILAIVSYFVPNVPLAGASRKFLNLMLLTAAAFVLLFGVAQGRNSPHYLLTTYLSLNIISALGWCFLILWLGQWVGEAGRIQVQYLAGLLLCGVQIWSAFSFYPYYFTYRNPILYSMGAYREFPQKPYGEGLEHAAAYLANLPDAKDSVALTYYARGCFSFFYPGETTRFKPYYVDDGYEGEFSDALQSADYLVVYYAAQIQSDRYDSFFEGLSGVTPLHEVWLDDYKYVVIYDLHALPESTLQALTRR
jgi:hypothetical protein